ncbi:hypothetical protein F4778DRAFT_735341 [Xylariomycetidae sp. FL2044]|nr:hypothetical protein F4778DRAFT_735341 [Xylariomycetidae sp. FL2044]
MVNDSLLPGWRSPWVMTIWWAWFIPDLINSRSTGLCTRPVHTSKRKIVEGRLVRDVIIPDSTSPAQVLTATEARPHPRYVCIRPGYVSEATDGIP